MTIYGYARVSGTSQDLSSQVAQLKDAGATDIYHEKHTGTTMDRPEFNKVIDVLKKGDTLVVTKLDRFARTAGRATVIIEDLLEQGVSVNVLNIGKLSGSSSDNLMMNMLAAISQFERDMIVERLAEGKAIARQREDYREGRPPKYSRLRMNEAMTLLESNSYTQVADMTGISKATLTRYRRKQRMEAGVGIPT